MQDFIFQNKTKIQSYNECNQCHRGHLLGQFFMYRSFGTVIEYKAEKQKYIIKGERYTIIFFPKTKKEALWIT